jgi:PAS domain S-box-containing protein/putative nucleotidyltransferase with HDIG domain
MERPLRVLIVEDSEDDTLLVIRVLKRGGYDPVYERVETEEGMVSALSGGPWDVILCDYMMPRFSALRALELFKESGIDIPFIIVSGSIGEEIAVEAMRAGAHDYIMKDRLQRLVPAIERELREADSRVKRKQAEDSLRRSEGKYREIIDNMQEGYHEVDIKGNFTFFNDSMCKIMGYEREELLGMNNRQYADEENASKVYQTYNEVYQTGEPVKNFEWQIIRKDGDRRDIDVSISLIKNREGHPTGFRGIVRDITDRKRMEEAIHTSEQRLSDIIQFLPDATFVIDKKGIVMAWNRAIEKMTGVAAEDMIGRGEHEYAIPFYGEKRPILIDLALCPQPEMESSYTGIWRKGDILYGEAFTPNLPGGKAHLSATASVLRDKSGEIVAAIECIRDNTERKKAQEDLREAEERYRGIFENTQEGVYRSVREGRFILANPAMARIFGYNSPGELIAAVTDITRQLYVHPEERKKLLALLEERGVVSNYEVEFYRKDGSPFWASLNLRAVRNGQERLVYYEGVIEDITDRKGATERMRKALRATVQAIAVTVETRDPYTAGHQKRVADLARSIATEMGLPADQIDGLRTAAIIHDLGKISVPAEILSKPTKLSAIEFELIKIHPQSGYEILKDVEFPWPVARMILEHHERMDGSGYPRGLKGDETLLESRILQVADVVESMASYRPYRPALGVDAALEEITGNKGVLYDSEVVDVCVRLFRHKGYQLEQFEHL